MRWTWVRIPPLPFLAFLFGYCSVARRHILVFSTDPPPVKVRAKFEPMLSMARVSELTNTTAVSLIVAT
ncbi:hypothetical protein VUR80DRAFT_7016 [Thermomyces stellatus]